MQFPVEQKPVHAAADDYTEPVPDMEQHGSLYADLAEPVGEPGHPSPVKAMNVDFSEQSVDEAKFPSAAEYDEVSDRIQAWAQTKGRHYGELFTTQWGAVEPEFMTNKRISVSIQVVDAW